MIYNEYNETLPKEIIQSILEISLNTNPINFFEEYEQLFFVDKYFNKKCNDNFKKFRKSINIFRDMFGYNCFKYIKQISECLNGQFKKIIILDSTAGHFGCDLFTYIMKKTLSNLIYLLGTSISMPTSFIAPYPQQLDFRNKSVCVIKTYLTLTGYCLNSDAIKSLLRGNDIYYRKSYENHTYHQIQPMTIIISAMDRLDIMEAKSKLHLDEHDYIVLNILNILDIKSDPLRDYYFIINQNIMEIKTILNVV